MTKFSEMLDRLERGEDGWTVAISDDWLQGRTVYGGLAAALCLEACGRELADLPPLRSAQFAYVGPATGRLRIRPTLLRQGKSAVFVRVELLGELGLATHATFCLAANRSSSLVHDSTVRPSPRRLDECPTVFDRAPQSLAFIQHFDARLAAGYPPFSGAAPDMTIWARHRDTAAPSSLTSLIAIADTPPPAAFVLAKQPGPMSTMTWSVDALSTKLKTSEGWWLVRANAETAGDGYSSQSMTVWSADGTPVLASRQTCALFL